MRKVAVITGASRGLGAHLADALAQDGYSLALGARDLKSLKALAVQLPGEILPLALDVSDPASVLEFRSEVFDELGPIELLINNAGVGIFKRLEDSSTQDFRQTFAVNVQGAWQMTMAFLPELVQNQGLVIMVSSDASTRVFENGGLYCASKFALRAIARTLQIENPKLRVLELRPGAIDTYFAGTVPGAPGKERFLKPEDVAATVRLALQLPSKVRLEELVVRSSEQSPEF
jgi:3-oxoacyl-[acyl-carrier protein] reductase